MRIRSDLRPTIMGSRNGRTALGQRTAVAAFLLAAAGLLPAQQNVDAAAIKQYLSNRGVTPSAQQLDAVARQYGVSPSAIRNLDTSAQGAGEPVPKDAAPQDTLAPRTDQVSVYESIVRETAIEPDSLLGNLSMFGHEVFAKPSAAGLTAALVSVPAAYPVGPGDEVIILLWGRINDEYRLVIDREGKINVPHLGTVSVGGQPFQTMQRNLLDRLHNIEGVSASVSMGELRSIGIYIVGEVMSPGFYTISPLSSVTNALFAAGGPNKRGSLRNIQLKRNGRLVAKIDFYDFLLAGEERSGLKLHPGDVILVPIAENVIAVAGNVRRSGLYEILPKTTLKEAIRLAGGIAPSGWTNRIQIERFQDNQYQVVLDLESDDPKSIPSFEVQDGDIVRVFPVVIQDYNAVFLSGNVLRPGKYELKTGMKVSDIISDFDCLLPETYFEYAVVLRKEPPTFLERIVPFNLKNAVEEKGGIDDLLLQTRDEIIVYPRDYFEPDRTVSVGGAVTNPGRQKLLENMKVRDLIIMAGGVLEEASTERGELYRRSGTAERITIEKIDFCVECALSDDPQHNLLLRKFDRVYIRRKEGWAEERRVLLEGEFIFPGEYVLLEGETLGHLLERCGGFTGEAYLPAALLTRPSVRALEKVRIDQYTARLQGDVVKLASEMALREQQFEEAQEFLKQQQMVIDESRGLEPIGRVVIDLSKPDQYSGFILEDGDRLYVPRAGGTVSVLGEVYSPATFRYEKARARVSYYVERAGGLKENADARNVYIFKADGSVTTRKSTNIMRATLSPGDVVVVPQKFQYKNNFRVFMDVLEAGVKISTILTAIAVVLLAASR
jgi:protein involved in polysaccharide export with SLBB domain